MVAVGLAMLLALPLQAQTSAQQSSSGQGSTSQDSGFVLRAETDLVLTNVVVRDSKTGRVVEGLKRSDFTIIENGKPQQITDFDFESVDMAKPLDEATISGLASTTNGKGAVGTVRPEDLKNHRLIVFFFDLTSMQPEDLDRSVDAAKDFLQHKMQPADLIALVSLDTELKVDQDFTSNKDLLIGKIGMYNGTEGAAFAQGANANSNQVEDASGYTPDETEYNDINTDRELFALRAVAQSLERINQKKSLLYFSGGLTRDGMENQASLRAAINAAVRANLSIYSLDTRGLQAVSALGDASTGSLRGSGGFNGVSMQNNMNANFDSQETLTTLSADTGGKAFLDNNDFSPAFAQVQRDSAEYYVVGFHSNNPARDGKFRKLTIKVNRPGVKLEYRPGYYAPADFKHSGKEDRERELEDELASDLPATDVALYMDAYYFRLNENRFYVPVSLLVPGSQIPFVKGGDKDKATLDVIGEVLDEAKRPIGHVRDTVKLAVNQQLEARQKNIQYSTSFNLPPGKYHLKFVVRENQDGHMGSFEADIVLPDMRKSPMKMSSILLASQRVPSKASNPLVREGEQYIPNISHVFRQGQHLYLLYEVYGPAKEKADASGNGTAKTVKGAINLISSLELIHGSTKVFETPVVRATSLNEANRDAVALELDVPLDKLGPGSYIGQLNVIDDAGGSFAFPRFAVLVRSNQNATGNAADGSAQNQ
ncbi:VWA domain-containing protein [Acidicapsa dinghuensis]|uniref:VWA domain-containing protein n=1 Tax=Acidicapsa dinghuensis TaxID=2218256 RepID=A0ABW1EEC9_9BACT|nr:VWA domain-containing protein [Acidicapsa dinghuensis]